MFLLERGWPNDDAGRDKLLRGLSAGLKPDFLRCGDGDGGTWESVSMALSDSEGLGRRRTRGPFGGLANSSWGSPDSPVVSCIL